MSTLERFLLWFAFAASLVALGGAAYNFFWGGRDLTAWGKNNEIGPPPGFTTWVNQIHNDIHDNQTGIIKVLDDVLREATDNNWNVPNQVGPGPDNHVEPDPPPVW